MRRLLVVFFCLFYTTAYSANVPPSPYDDLHKLITEQLTKEYESARARETSSANKLLTATSMAATGIGGMQLASGLAEQRADAAAERDMAAYLATFTCTYGDKRASGGDTNLELPAANLFELKRKYVSLATDLKSRKDALGLKPGIESEELADSAMAGVYDNEHTGKPDGAYTSLSRALSDPTGEDATEWNAQKDATTQKIKTSAAVGGIGATGGTVGNLIINRDKK